MDTKILSMGGKAHSGETESDIEIPILSSPKIKKSETHRLSSFDLFRGIIMIIMLIDHYDGALTTTQQQEFWSGIQPGYYTTFNGNLSLALYKFILRFSSAICAPGFFFLMGFGLLHYYHHRTDTLKWPKLQIAKYLFMRGVLLLILNFYIVLTIIIPWYYCTFSNTDETETGQCTHHIYGTNVLYSLGANLILFIPILMIENYLYSQKRLFLSYTLLFCITLFSIICTQLITPKYSEAESINISDMESLLFVPAAHSQYYYPMIPWTAFASIGLMVGRTVFVIKKYYKNKISMMYLLMFVFGVVFLIAFAVIRYIGSLDFGNFGYKWYDEELVGASGGWIVMQFFLTTKYPPSLCYFLLWNGCIFIILSMIYYICDYNNDENKHNKLYHIVIVYGNTALFFFMIHIIPSIYLNVGLSGGLSSSFLYPMVQYDRLSVWINVISIGVCVLMLIVLYPICLCYKKFKSQKPHTSYWKLL